MPLQIYINTDTLLDVDENAASVNLSSEVERVGQFNIVPSSSALPFSVPKTSRNRQALSLLEDVFDIVIGGAGIEILKGKGKKTETNNRYEIDSWGTNANWITELENLTLSDIATNENLTTVWDGTTIDDNLNALASEGTDPSGTSYPAFAYFPILYRKQLDRNWNNTDLYPNMNIFWLIEKAFLSKGWQIQSEFMGKVQYRRRYIPYCWGRFGRSAEYYQENTNLLATLETVQNYPVHHTTNPSPQLKIVSIEDETTAPNFDTGANYNNATYIYTVPADGIYFISVSDIEFRNSVSSGSTNYEIKIRIWAKDNVYASETIDEPKTVLAGTNYWELGKIETTAELSTGDEIYVDATVTYTGGSSVYSSTFSLHNTKLEVTKQPYYAEGDTIYFDEFLPKDVRFIDLLKGEKDCFNLKIVANPNTKIVTIEPRNKWIENWATGNTGDGYFDETLTIQNLTRLVDSATIQHVFFDNFSRDFTFKYQSDSRDGFLTLIENENDKHPNQTTYRFNNRFEVGEQFFINSFYAATVHCNVDTGGSIRYMPIMLSEKAAEIADAHNDNDLKFTPKAVYYQGSITGRWSFRGAIPLLFYRSYSVDYANLDATAWNLAYGDVIASSGTAKGLATKYFHRQLFNLKLPYVVAAFKIGASDFSDFNHRRPCYLDILQYVVLGINNFNALGKQFTRFTLMQNRYPLSSDLDNFTHEPLQALTLPPKATDYLETTICTEPCEGEYLDFDVYTDFASTLSKAAMEDYQISSIILNGVEYVTSGNITIVDVAEPLAFVDVEANSTLYPYMTNFADELRSFLEIEGIAGDLQVSYSSVVIEGSAQHIHFRVRACHEFLITVYDITNALDLYRWSQDNGFEHYDAGWQQGGGYYSSVETFPINVTTIETCG